MGRDLEREVFGGSESELSSDEEEGEPKFFVPQSTGLTWPEQRSQGKSNRPHGAGRRKSTTVNLQGATLRMTMSRKGPWDQSQRSG